MSADLTLPGTIPGLLRRGSPVVVVSLCDETTDCDGWRLAVGDHGTVTDGPTSYVVVAGTTVSGEGPPWSELPVGCVALDLTDATGRAHAAWWVAARWEDYHGLNEILGPGHYGAIVEADNGEPMAEDTIRRLRAVVLQVAGVTP